MKVRVRCYGMLREHLPFGVAGSSAWVEVPAGTTVAAVAGSLEVPDRHLFAVLVNGVQADPSTELHERDEVTFMPPFSGG